jgi:hypothetical protein
MFLLLENTKDLQMPIDEEHAHRSPLFTFNGEIHDATNATKANI